MSWKSWKFGSLVKKLPVVHDLAGWAAERGIPVRPIAPARAGQRFPSRSIPETLHALLDKPARFVVAQRREWDLLKYSRLYMGESYPIAATHVLDIPNCWLHVPSGTVFSADREVLAFSTIALHSVYEGHAEAPWDEAPWMEGNTFLLSSAWGKNYAHWLMDALPRAATLREKTGHQVLIDRRAPSFQKESLQLLGLDESQIVEPPANLVRCRNLTLHVAAPRSGLPHPTLLQEVCARLHSSAESPKKPTRRLYITRQQTRRGIVNHEEVEPVLARFGFETVVSESLSFPEQVRLFSESEAILGAHGAGTLNVLFAPRGSHLIELYNPLVWDHAAHRVASLGGVHHWHLLAENVGKAYDIRVNPGHLEKLLQTALPGAGTPLPLESEF